MYTVNATKIPAVRPRSSLSTDDNHHYRSKGTSRGSRRPNNTVLTLAAFCAFLLVLCSFLLGTLIYIGKSIANGNYLNRTAVNATAANSHLYEHRMTVAEKEHLRLQTKPLLRFTTQDTTVSSLFDNEATDYKFEENTEVDAAANRKLFQQTMNTSKLLRQMTYRLPKELKPKHYQLRLHPDLKQMTFNGSVLITVEVLKPIAYIPVHARNLNVSTKEVRFMPDVGEKSGNVIPFSKSFSDLLHELWITEFEKPLDIGHYVLNLNFTGSLKGHITGFYQSSYLNPLNRQIRWIATSKFEPTYARQAFPCFDEPAMKAKFVITIVRPTGDGYHALSNMNIEDEVDLGNTTEVIFAESVPMSTYLACFIVSDFAHESQTVKGVLPNAKDFEMRVFSTAAQVNKVKYSLDIGVKITEYYIKMFNVEYPLPKLDLAAIPDFVSGAMEHWGLVTFRETALLYDENISSSSNKQRVATVVAHELAHMWFGNLVTMKWWNDLWLNEGFANYIEYKGVDSVHPEWNMLDQFLITDLHGVLKLDATLASHPIVQIVEQPSEITELFDAITYSKGSAIIRMLEHLVGEEKFRNAVTSYLQKFIYGNAETDDFLSEVEAQEFDFGVKMIMRTWTEQMGLPVVNVQRTGNTFTLTQKRFLSNPLDYNATFANSEFNYHWSIPITYFTDANSEVQNFIFNYNDNEAKIDVPEGVNWIKLNKNQIGYYRVNYEKDNWLELTKALVDRRGIFSESDRAHLINDVFALADAAQLDYGIALNLTTYLQNELNYVPWSVGSSHLTSIRNLLYYTDVHKDFMDYARRLFEKPYEVVGWSVGPDHTFNLLRVTILNAACSFGYEPALQEAARQFTAWLANPSVRPQPDIRSIVYYYGMQAVGNEKVWNQVWELFVNEPDAQEKIRLMEALAGIKEPWILQRFIVLAKNESYVRSQDYFTCLTYISNNRIGQSLVWDYVRENWLNLVERFTINERNLGRLIPSITSRFTTQTKLEEMKAFFDKYPEAGAGTKAREEAFATVKYNIEWLEHNKNQVSDWLQLRRIEDENAMETTTATPFDIEMKSTSS